jgi:hypothetical protein
MPKISAVREVEVDNVRLHVPEGETCATVDIQYPRSGPVTTVEIGIECLRAADSIRVFFDFDRNGYVIQQGSGWHGPYDGINWQEVAFIGAWALEPEDRGSDN